jgi:hypothetical protein
MLHLLWFIFLARFSPEFIKRSRDPLSLQRFVPQCPSELLIGRSIMMNSTKVVGYTTAFATPLPIFTSGKSPWTIEAISGIVFGVIMLLVALYTIWQSRCKHRTGARGSSSHSLDPYFVTWLQMRRVSPTLPILSFPTICP